MLKNLAKYQCGSCGFFKSKVCLGKHIRQVHGIDVNMSLRRSYSTNMSTGYNCGDCGFKFKTIIEIIKHLDELHGLHIAYVKGISKRRCYLDGI